MTNVFAIGDIANISNQMAYYAGLHAKVCVDNINKLEEKKPVAAYAGDGEPMMSVPLGPKQGFTQAKGKVLPALITSNMKGKDLFAAMSWKLMGAPRPKPGAEVKAPEDKEKKEDKAIRAKALAAALKIDEEAALKFMSEQPLRAK